MFVWEIISQIWNIKKKPCKAIRSITGKCIQGRNGNFLVAFEDGKKAVALGRLLRKLNNENQC